MTRPRVLVAGVALALSSFGCRRSDDAAHPHRTDAASVSATAPEVSGTAASTSGHADHAAPPNAPAGYASISVSPAVARAIGLQTARVEEREFSKRVRTTGVVVLDETRTSHVHAKVRGWIETVNADFVGKRIRAGAPLCTLYSQEVLAAQLEFLSVLGQSSGAPALSGPLGEAERRAREQLLTAARGRLELWDVPAAEIARLEASREPHRTFTLDAPRTGIVIAKQAVAGMFIDPSVELFVVSDTRKLWVLADLYASDVAGVRLGAPATLAIEGQPGARVPAAVAFLPPTIEEATRTLEVRFDVDNADGAIRPGAFATVELDIDLGRSLAIPEAAVIHAGREAIAFVVEGDRLEPRSVRLGPLVSGHYGVHAGLEAGESVATGAQFLIDSESRLRASSGKGPSHGGH